MPTNWIIKTLGTFDEVLMFKKNAQKIEPFDQKNTFHKKLLTSPIDGELGKVSV